MVENKSFEIKHIYIATGLGTLLTTGLWLLLTTLFHVKIVVPKTPPSTSPPIKVRGGAMTFRSKEWSTVVNSNIPCIVADNTQIELDDVVSINKPAGSHLSVTYPGLQPTWQMDLYVRNFDGTPQTTYGMRLMATTDCKAKNTPGVTVVGEDQSNDTYYPYKDEANATDEDGATRIRRYRSTSCARAGATSITSGDEDLCEHLSSIYFNLKPTNTPTQSPDYSNLCQNGECAIKIGIPQ